MNEHYSTDMVVLGCLSECILQPLSSQLFLPMYNTPPGVPPSLYVSTKYTPLVPRSSDCNVRAIGDIDHTSTSFYSIMRKEPCVTNDMT